jgi:hypothetical protein
MRRFVQDDSSKIYEYRKSIQGFYQKETELSENLSEQLLDLRDDHISIESVKVNLPRSFTVTIKPGNKYIEDKDNIVSDAYKIVRNFIKENMHNTTEELYEFINTPLLLDVFFVDRVIEFMF